MRSVATFIALVATLLAMQPEALAASLRLAPTTLDLVAPDSAAVLSLKNDDAGAINVQIRVFRWTQVDGVDQLTPTRDVVASPPAMALKPGAVTVVRIVRVSKSPPASEESYRVLVDELPDSSKHRAGAVALVLRYSIPIFFTPPQARPPQIAWSVLQHEGKPYLSAKNSGERRVRVSDLSVKDSNGGSVTLRQGLAGYVLGGSIMRWPLDGVPSLSGSSVTVTANSEAGRIDAIALQR